MQYTTGMKYVQQIIAIVLIVTCYSHACYSQNLVLNPGFEQVNSCPTGISEFYLASNWSTVNTPGTDSCSTPDLYSACSSGQGGVNVPNALLGYHYARTGFGKFNMVSLEQLFF